jgi:hypothetical protein
MPEHGETRRHDNGFRLRGRDTFKHGEFLRDRGWIAHAPPPPTSSGSSAPRPPEPRGAFLVHPFHPSQVFHLPQRAEGVPVQAPLGGQHACSLPQLASKNHLSDHQSQTGSDSSTYLRYIKLEVKSYDLFGALNFGHSHLFRVSCFELRIFGRIHYAEYHAAATGYLLE